MGYTDPIHFQLVALNEQKEKYLRASNVTQTRSNQSFVVHCFSTHLTLPQLVYGLRHNCGENTKLSKFFIFF